MSTGTVSVHSWNDSIEIPTDATSAYGNTTPTISSPSYDRPSHPGYIDIPDGGSPEMGASYNARLQAKECFKASRVGLDRGWSRQQGRGLRSNPVRPVRYGVDAGGDEEEGGW